MAKVEGLRVLVEGDLPEEVLVKVSEAVRRAALEAVADLDLAPALREVPLEPTDFPAAQVVEPGGDKPGDKLASEATSEAAADESAFPIELIPILLGIWFKSQSEA